jgi:RNA polymerase sigma factor for flagellar operon FliA
MKSDGSRPSQDEINLWWAKYQRDKDDLTRNRLMELYLPLVRYTSERVHTKLPDEVNVDDLFSAGVLGLIDAVKAFDPKRNVKFETYCVQRIRGAILDELRTLDWVPRLVRYRAHKLNQAVAKLEAIHGRKPSERELAEFMRLPMGEFRKLQRDAKAITLVSLSRKWFETDSHKDVREIDILEDKRSEDPLLSAQRKDVQEVMTRGLSRAERLIIMLYYFEDMTMKQIGDTLDLSESRVSQMHSAVLERLRGQLDRRKKELQTA